MTSTQYVKSAYYLKRTVGLNLPFVCTYDAMAIFRILIYPPLSQVPFLPLSSFLSSLCAAPHPWQLSVIMDFHGIF